MADDRTLLRRMRRGSNAAAEQLWERCAPGLLLYARSMLSPSDADDVVQQAFCRVFELPSRRIADVREVRAWLASIVRSIALNTLRSQRRESARHQRSAQLRLLETQLEPEIDAALQTLSAEHREAIVLRHLAGLTFDQIALATGENRSTIASRHRAALARLREILDEPRAAAPDLPVSLGEPRHV